MERILQCLPLFNLLQAMQKPKDDLGTIIERMRDSMSNELVSAMRNAGFSVRSFESDGQTLFVGDDIANALDIPTDEVPRRCKHSRHCYVRKQHGHGSEDVLCITNTDVKELVDYFGFEPLQSAVVDIDSDYDCSLVSVVSGDIVVSSRDVAENFSKEHRHVLESIREILAAEKSAANFFHESSYDNRGKKYPQYLMNRDGFSLLVMGFTGKEALQWKLKYIEAFNDMEKTLRQRHAFEVEETHRRRMRAASVPPRKSTCKTLSTTRHLYEISDNKQRGYCFGHFTNAIYLALFDMKASEIKHILGISDDDSIRDNLTAYEITAVTSAEKKAEEILKSNGGEYLTDYQMQKMLELWFPKIDLRESHPSFQGIEHRFSGAFLVQ